MADVDSTLLDDAFNETDHDYNYDYADSVNQFNWNELIPTTIVYTITLLLGVSGNLLIIITISKYRRMKSITNTFLASLASADLLLVLVCTPVKLAKLFSYTWDIGWTMCKLIHYAQNVSAICSVFTLTAMSVERYYAIVHPMKAKYVCTTRQARKIIITTWVASFLLAIPILFLQTHMEVGDRRKGYWCITNFEWELAWKMHEVYMLVIVLIIPVTVMIVTYSAICREICKVAQRRYQMTSAKGNLTFESYPLSSKKVSKIKTKTTKLKIEEDNATLKQNASYKSEKQVIKMLVAVVIIFVICWAPLLILNVLNSFEIVNTLQPGPYKHMKTAFHLMAYFNRYESPDGIVHYYHDWLLYFGIIPSLLRVVWTWTKICVNPVVYGFMSKNFRESFTKALCCRRGTVRRQLSVSHTRTTSLRTYIN